MKDINAMTPMELLAHIRHIEAKVEELTMPPRIRVVTIVMKDDSDDAETQELCDKLKRWSTKNVIKSIHWGYKQ